MARGIDHRDKESVVEAYRNGQKPNWCLFAGTEPVVPYEGDDMEDGATRLEQCLSMLENNGTTQVYILRCYNKGVNNITNKTPYSCSTTMNLNPEAPTTRDPATGMMIIDRTARASPAAPSNNNQYTDFLVQQLKEVTASNKQLVDQLNDSRQKALEDKINFAISGLQNKQQDRVDKLIDMIVEKPSVIKDTIGALVDIFRPAQKNYIVTPPASTAAISGTEQQASDEVKEEEEEELTEEEEDKLLELQEKACDNLGERLGIDHFTNWITGLCSMSDDQLLQWAHQEEAINKIRARLQPDIMTKLVQQVAALDDKGLNKMLNYLD